MPPLLSFLFSAMKRLPYVYASGGIQIQVASAMTANAIRNAFDPPIEAENAQD
jgi:hypothetical protein